MNTDLLEAHARELEGLPQEWRAYSFECFPHGGRETIYYELVGANVRELKKDGLSGWYRCEPNTTKTVIIKADIHRVWLAAWELKTGTCSECAGSGKELESASATGGVKYRACFKCKGSGEWRSA